MFLCFKARTKTAAEGDSPEKAQLVKSKASNDENQSTGAPHGDADFLLGTSVEKGQQASGILPTHANSAALAPSVSDELAASEVCATSAPGAEPSVTLPEQQPTWQATWRTSHTSALPADSSVVAADRLLDGCPSSSAGTDGMPAHSTSSATLLCPRISMLSRVLSCSGRSCAGDEEAERHAPGCGLPGGPTSAAEYLGPAARRLVFLPRQQLAPLPQPDSALEHAAALLGRSPGEPDALLAAILILRRTAVHHRALLAGFMSDVTQLLLDCSRLPSHDACRAALLALADLIIAWPSAMTMYVEKRLIPEHSTLLQLLTLASNTRDPVMAGAARSVLWTMATTMPQMPIMRLLERYIEHRLPHIRSEASRLLMVVTYRRS